MAIDFEGVFMVSIFS